MTVLKNVHIIKRVIDNYGISREYVRRGKDKYNADTGTNETFFIKGLYHEASSSYITITGSNSGRIQTKNQPGILTVDKVMNIKIDDEFTINSKLYKVTGIIDFQNETTVHDISIEVVQ